MAKLLNQLQWSSNLNLQWSNDLNPQWWITEQAKSDIFATMNKQYPWREFGEHDLKQVQESLEAEGKNPNDTKTVFADMQDYANKTWWAMWEKTEEQEMKMTA